MSCDHCRLRKFAERERPGLLGRLWLWHSRWCPGWKAYLEKRKEYGEGPPRVGSRRGLWE
jgi:hypothetical protein